MKLFYSGASPYVRKCMVVAHELGLAARIEHLPAAAHPVNRDPNIVRNNPLGKVPTLLTDDGTVLYDSRVICEFLNELGGGKLFPAGGAQRWQVLTEQSLGDGILDAALLARYEGAMRPEPLRWADWTTGQLDKIHCGLAAIDAKADSLGDRVDIGTITMGCVLGYLDLRFDHLGWRQQHAKAAAWFARFNARAAMQATLPKA
ncbi:MAG: glutathione S-transferase [Burkholderiaceae bacterium]|nr:glutathione S-transferase [Burkholderiaceae bacterium]